MRTPYLTPLLLAGFLLLAGAWFFLQPAAPEPAATTPPPAAAPARTGSPTSFGRTPFLTTHEPAPAVAPDAANVAPSFHVEMEDLKRRLDAAPEDTAALLRLARLKQDGHQTDEAIAYYRRYLARAPDARQAWLDLAQSLGQLERWDEALEATEALLERFPNDPAGLYNLGAVHANAGRPAEARAVWERVAAQDGDATLRAMAASALQRLGPPHP